MAIRRSSGEGSVFQAADGRWVVMVDLPRRADGRRHRRKRRARTKAEAQRLLREMRAEIEEFGRLPSTDRKVWQMIDDYLVQVRAPSGRSRKVIERDELFAATLRAFFGDRSVVKVTVEDCDGYLAAFVNGQLTGSDRPVSRDYARRARAFLAGAFRNELRRGLVNRNPAEVAVIPEAATTKQSKRALSADEWRKLYDLADGVVKVGIDLAGRHGLRPQEVRAVRWSQIDFDRGTLSVVTQLDADDEFTDTKTQKSTRTIRLHPEALALLAEWRVTQQELHERPEERWTDRDLVVATRYGTAINQSNHRRSIKELAERIGLGGLTPYELRHTAITHQVEAGHSASTVADWAGTSERMIYQHYRHQLREVVELQPPDF
ncbi:MAG: tyrosine-type recombinase/integrase [Acidimicrobiales bacterium]